jgi:hypothetical protein
MQQKPSVGRIVRYMTRDGDTTQPAIVVQVWNPESEDSLVNLQVLTDGSTVWCYVAQEDGSCCLRHTVNC